MSKQSENPTPETPTSAAATSKKIGRLLRAKKIGIIAVVSATAISAVILIAALLPRRANGFIVQLDPAAMRQHFSMVTSAKEEEAVQTTYLSADVNLSQGWPTLTQTVKTHYEGFEVDSLSGGHVFSEDGVDKALFYTFYLRNDSQVEQSVYRIQGYVTSRADPTEEGTRLPYEYLRICMREGYVGEPDDTVTYYANRNIQEAGTYENGVEDRTDSRECLSYWDKHEYGRGTADYYYLREPTYKDGDIAYCVNFDNRDDRNQLFDARDHVIAPGKTRRITFIAYFEGEDPDCGGLPVTAKMGYGLTIGI